MENYQLIITIVGANLLVFIGFMGSVMSLITHQVKKTHQQIEGMNNLTAAIHQEMKDFHERLWSLERCKKDKGK